jgi:hypothetical protein
MRGRECCNHRHAGHGTTERQHGLDALTRRRHIACRTEADRVPEKVAIARRGVSTGALSRWR